MSYVCTTCDQKFETIPKDAVQLIPGNHRVNLLRFVDGTIHSLRLAVAPGRNARALHNRWHKILIADCVFCYPPPVPPEPVVREVVQVLETLPEPQPKTVVEINPKPEVETNVEPNTSMAAAFKRSFKRSSANDTQ